MHMASSINFRPWVAVIDIPVLRVLSTSFKHAACQLFNCEKGLESLQERDGQRKQRRQARLQVLRSAAAPEHVRTPHGSPAVA